MNDPIIKKSKVILHDFYMLKLLCILAVDLSLVLYIAAL